MTAHQNSLGDAERELWQSFHAMRRKLDRALDLQLQRDSQVSASEFEILQSINLSPEQRLRVTEIATSVDWEKSRVSHLVRRMEKRELITRSDCDTDARGFWIGLTDAGRTAVQTAMSGHVAAIRRYFFDVIEPEQADHLKQISGRVLGAIGSEADDECTLGVEEGCGA